MTARKSFGTSDSTIRWSPLARPIVEIGAVVADLPDSAPELQSALSKGHRRGGAARAQGGRELRVANLQ